MNRLLSLSRLLTGMLLICLGCVAFVGCNDLTSVTGLVPSQLTGAIARPNPAPAGTPDTITWLNPADDPNPASNQAIAVSEGLTLSSPSMTFTATSSVAGQSPAIILDIINDATGAVVGSSAPIPIVQSGTGLATGQIAIPQTKVGQSYMVRLASWTVLTTTVQALTRQVPANLQIGTIAIAFDVIPVNAASVNASTFQSFTLNLNKNADNKFILRDSTLLLNWPAGIGHPTDEKAGLVLRCFDGIANAGTHRQTRPIVNDAVLFSGISTAPFNRVDVLLDIRNAKPTPTDLNFPD